MDWFPATHRCLALVVFVVFLASACGSGQASTSNYVDLPERPVAQNGLRTTTASGVDVALVRSAPDPAPARSVAQERFDEVEAFYDQYLQLRANAIDRTDSIEVINAVTTAAGRAEVADALAYNDGQHADERLSAVDALYLYSNVETILQADDNTIVLIDCTEQHELNVLEQHLAFWQTNEVRIDTRDGQLRVDSFTTTHNGYLDFDQPLGCAPISFRERAESTAARVWTELGVWGQNVDGRSAGNLSERIDDPLRQLVLDAAATASTQKFAFAEHVDNAEFVAVGIETHGRLGALGPEGIIVQVESCHRFPEGRTGIDLATQTEVQDLGPGAQQFLRFHVLIDPDFGEDRVDTVVAIEYVADRCAR